MKRASMMGFGTFPALGNRFTVGQLVARGGMAAVFEIFDERGNALAAKIPYREMMANPVARERFLREAALLCSLRSPFIVRGHGVAETEDGVPMLVMDLLRGEDLATTLQRTGTVGVTRAVLNVVHGCAALASLHRVGVIHRDLKPSNLFVTSAPDDLGAAVLLDLGVVKSQADSGVTVAGCVVGSPAYMAPEQMLGQEDLDHRADIWSIGVVLYELLTGRVPFEGRNMMHVLSRALFNQKDPIARFRTDVPPEVEEVVARCLAVEPAQRFQDVLDVAEALLPCLPPWIARRVLLPLRAPVEERPSGAYLMDAEDPALTMG